MPLYDYRCRTCSNVTEVRHGFRETYDGSCPNCGSDDLARVFNPAGIVFKGSGFYLTDSRKAAEAAKSSPSGSGKASAEPGKASSDSGKASSDGASSSSSSDAGPKKSESSAA